MCYAQIKSRFRKSLGVKVNLRLVFAHANDAEQGITLNETNLKQINESRK